MNSSNNSKLRYIIVILLAQSFLFLCLTIRIYNSSFGICFKSISNIILGLAIGIFVVSIIIVRDLFKIIADDMKYRLKEDNLKQDKKLIKNLRSQKHDFSNHLQTVYGMLQLNKVKKAIEYISSLNNDLSKLNCSNSDYQNCILDSILISKQKVAVDKEIMFEYQVESGIENVNLSLNKIFRVLSNLVDNAIEAVEDYDGKAKIKVTGTNHDDQYILSVYNNGAIINSDLLAKIFEPGFSTKGLNRGYGLYIIKSLVEKSGGQLEVKSEESFGTKFICSLKKI